MRTEIKTLLKDGGGLPEMINLQNRIGTKPRR